MSSGALIGRGHTGRRPPITEPFTSSENVLLAALPAQERARLDPLLEHTMLEVRQVVQQVNAPVDHLWFPRRGVLSMVLTMIDGASVEVATIGREGMVGLGPVLGTDRMAQQVFCQVAGGATRLRLAAFRELRPELPQLNLLLLRYSAALMAQISQGSACNRLHALESRCARWLLMTRDRVDEDRFELTHEFLAQMLGVARPSVTIAAGMLQKAGIIAYVRGTVDILDRARLEEASCECYAVIKGVFARLVEPV